jgi:hypothetical protein
MAERVTQNPAGQLTITNIFDMTRAPANAERVTWPPCVVVAYLEWRAAEDGYRLEIALRIIDGSGKQVGKDAVLPPIDSIPGESGRPIRRPFSANLPRIDLPGVDDYTMQLIVNGELRAEFDFYVDQK